MAPVFALVSKNQALKSAFEHIVLAGIIFWFKSTGGFWSASFVIIALGYLYLETWSQSNRFLFGALSVGILVFFFPVSSGEEVYLSLLSAFIMYLIVGTKNLVFINRKLSAQIAYFLILGTAAYVLLLSMSFWGQIMFFILTAALFKELFGFLTEESRGENFLKGLTASLIISEIIWGLSLLPLAPIRSSIILVSTALLTHYLILRYTRESFTVKSVLKGIGIFLAMTLTIFLISSWNLS